MNLNALWYRKNPLAILLLPLSLVYGVAIFLRRKFYRFGLRASERVSVPVVIVGNITVGGTGKTPLVLWLVHYLRESGFRVGIITRGYKGESTEWPREVPESGDPKEFGDEPVLLAQHSGCPVFAGPDRVRTARALLKQHSVDVLLSDDGLQHYRLQRDVEIVVVDSTRMFGNGFLLPAGPLRESRRRLRRVDLVVYNGSAPGREKDYQMELMPVSTSRLMDSLDSRAVESFVGQDVHAVAGVGNPQRFFDGLTRQGLSVSGHAMPDHHAYRSEDLQFGDENPILITEKDAVKLVRLVDDPANRDQVDWASRVWVVRADAMVSEQVGMDVENHIRLAQKRISEGNSG